VPALLHRSRHHPDGFLLLQTQDGINTEMFRIQLTPQGTNGCPQVGLQCPQNLPPPAG
jgi:hypothetical protein